jgi:hypothetical protein
MVKLRIDLNSITCNINVYSCLRLLRYTLSFQADLHIRCWAQFIHCHVTLTTDTKVLYGCVTKPVCHHAREGNNGWNRVIKPLAVTTRLILNVFMTKPFVVHIKPLMLISIRIFWQKLLQIRPRPLLWTSPYNLVFANPFTIPSYVNLAGDSDNAIKQYINKITSGSEQHWKLTFMLLRCLVLHVC